MTSPSRTLTGSRWNTIFNFYCLDGQNAFLQVDLAVYKGRACVVVNVASKYFTLLQLAFDLSHLERFFYELDFE